MWCIYTCEWNYIISSRAATGTHANNSDCISEIKNTQMDNAKNMDVVILMCNLIEHSDNYWKTLKDKWQYCKDEPALDANGAIGDFPATNNNSVFFKCKQKITGQRIMMEEKMLN